MTVQLLSVTYSPLHEGHRVQFFSKISHSLSYSTNSQSLMRKRVKKAVIRVYFDPDKSSQHSVILLFEIHFNNIRSSLSRPTW
jgi:hypothetical protein